MPARDRLWMCPNHMENFLDNNVLETDRLSKRINLWKNFSISKMDLNAVKIDFIKKCKEDPLIPSLKCVKNSEEKNTESHNLLDRCKIPGAIKNVYIKMKNLSVERVEQTATTPTTESNETDSVQCASNRFGSRAFADENEKESVNISDIIIDDIIFKVKMRYHSF